MEVMGDVNYAPDKQVYGGTKDILGMMPKRVTQARPETAGMEELGTMIAPGLAKGVAPAVKGGGNLLGMAMNERMLAGQPILPSLAKEPQSAMFAVQPIDLNKGIYKPDLTMDEMLKVKDIPTVDRVRQSIDLVGEDQFKKMVNAQYQKYKPTDQDQEAMLVESVTLNILGKAQRNVEKTGLPSLQIQDKVLPVTMHKLEEKAGNQIVNISPETFDKAFSKTDWQYVGKGGEGGIEGRYKGFENWLKDAKSLTASNVSVNKDGGIVFGDGRHRYAVLRDMGLDKLPISMDKESIENAKKFGYLAE
jgi:hypothetical protein